MHLFALVHKDLVCADITEPPAGNGIGFGKGRTADGAFPHAGQRGDINVLMRREYDVFVGLVGDHDHVVFDGKISDRLQFFQCKDAAGGIGGIAEDHRFGFRVSKGVVQGVCVKGEGRWIQGHEHRFYGIKYALGVIVFKIRRKDHNFIAGI